MPTDLPRTQVTHTATVRHALEVAAKRWPNQRPGQLIVRLIEEGAKTVEEADKDLQQNRRERLTAIGSRYAEDYGTGYLDDVRTGWAR